MKFKFAPNGSFIKCQKLDSISQKVLARGWYGLKVRHTACQVEAWRSQFHSEPTKDNAFLNLTPLGVGFIYSNPDYSDWKETLSQTKF